jgi:hypothetical protein
MNLKTAVVSGLIGLTTLAAGVVSYNGVGIPTQSDPATLTIPLNTYAGASSSARQSSIRNGRVFRGGGTSFGK